MKVEARTGKRDVYCGLAISGTSLGILKDNSDDGIFQRDVNGLSQLPPAVAPLALVSYSPPY